MTAKPVRVLPPHPAEAAQPGSANHSRTRLPWIPQGAPTGTMILAVLPDAQVRLGGGEQGQGLPGSQTPQETLDQLRSYRCLSFVQGANGSPHLAARGEN